MESNQFLVTNAVSDDGSVARPSTVSNDKRIITLNVRQGYRCHTQ